MQGACTLWDCVNSFFAYFPRAAMLLVFSSILNSIVAQNHVFVKRWLCIISVDKPLPRRLLLFVGEDEHGSELFEEKENV